MTKTNKLQDHDSARSVNPYTPLHNSSAIWFVLLTLILMIIALPAWSATIYLVRHAEKHTDEADPGLTDLGQCRAQYLQTILRDSNIQNIYSTNYRRTRETAIPLAKSLELGVKFYDPSALTEFATQLKTSSSNTLVVGHSNTTPEMVRELGGNADDMPESEYTRLYQVILNDGQVISTLLRMPDDKLNALCQ